MRRALSISALALSARRPKKGSHSMARRRYSNFRPGAMLLAFLIGSFLWAVSQGQANVEQVFEVPIELRGHTARV